MDTSRPTTRLICPLISATAEAMADDARRAVTAGAEMIELRLDYLRRPPTDDELRLLIGAAGVETIATCRPPREGGDFTGTEEQRLEILRRAAAAGAHYVDVEIDVPRDAWPDAQVILSHHDREGCPADLGGLAQRLDASDAAVSKIAFTAAGPEDALAALDVLHCATKPTIALAMGESGVLSRLLAPKFAAFGTFASLEPGSESAPGQPTLSDFHSLYRWGRVGPKTAVCGVLGYPVAHSMSPAIHNAAFAAADLDFLYVPLLVQPGPGPLRRFMDALLQRSWLDWRGLSVTLPHKEQALGYVDARHCDELTLQIGAANTVTFEPDGTLRGDNTDYAAATDSLCEAMGIDRAGLAGRRVAVLGAGGVARAIVAALAHYGANVTIYNRTEIRAQRLAAEFNCRADALAQAARAAVEVLINCTPLGMSPDVDTAPLPAIPAAVRVVFDTIYNPVETRLIRLARDAGLTVVTGLDMFVRQAVAQYEIWTGRPAPRDVMRQVVTERLGA